MNLFGLYLTRLVRSFYTSIIEVFLLLLTAILAIPGFLRVLPILLSIPQQVDFAAYYVASQNLNTSKALYQLTHTTNTAISGEEQFIYTDYIYPPVLATILRPLAYLSFDNAKAIWFLINIIFLALSIYICCLIIEEQRLFVVILSILVSIVSPPFYNTLILGQVNILLLLLVVGTLYFSSSRRRSLWKDIASGVLLGIATAIKLYPGVIGIVFLLHRRRTSLGVLILTSAAMFILGILGGGWSNTLQYFTQVLPELGGVQTTPGNQAMWGTLGRYFSTNSVWVPNLSGHEFVSITVPALINRPMIGIVLSCVFSIVISISTAYILIYSNIHNRYNSTLPEFSLIIIILLLLPPLVWDHYYTLLVIPTTLIICMYRERLTPKRNTRLILITSYLLIVLQRYWRIFLFINPSPFLQSFGFLSILLLWTTLLWIIGRNNRTLWNNIDKLSR